MVPFLYDAPHGIQGWSHATQHHGLTNISQTLIAPYNTEGPKTYGHYMHTRARGTLRLVNANPILFMEGLQYFKSTFYHTSQRRNFDKPSGWWSLDTGRYLLAIVLINNGPVCHRVNCLFGESIVYFINVYYMYLWYPSRCIVIHDAVMYLLLDLIKNHPVHHDVCFLYKACDWPTHWRFSYISFIFWIIPILVYIWPYRSSN